MSCHPCVFIVDDDPDVREALRRLLDSAGVAARTFAGAEDLLGAVDDASRGCALLDQRMPGLSGLDLQDALLERGIRLPVIFLTGHGQVPESVRAMKAGAVDFLLKPVGDDVLLSAVRRAFDLDARQDEARASLDILTERYARLTERQRQVMSGLLRGLINKEIAYELGIGERTVKLHRAEVMRRMEAATMVDLTRVADRLGIRSENPAAPR